MTEQHLTIYDTPLPTPESAAETMETLQSIMRAVLDDNDYATISGKKHRKRSGFAKLRRVFHITITVLEGEWEELGEEDFGYQAAVRASFPNGRYEDGDGYCDSVEMAHGRIAASRHNVRSKALTRAKNRASADLLGTGDVSAEEIGPDVYPKKAARAPKAKPKAAPQPAETKSATTNGRPLDAEAVRSTIRTKAKWHADGLRPQAKLVSKAQRQSVASLLNKALPYPDGEMQDKLRHDIYDYLIGVNSSTRLFGTEASAMIDWLKVDEDGDWNINGYAEAEVANIVAAISAEDQPELMEF